MTISIHRPTFTSILSGLLVCLIFMACQRQDNLTPDPDLVIRFQFDKDQKRLDNLGRTSEIPAGNAGQSPEFHQISAHYVELAPSALTQVGEGEILYEGAETVNGGDLAVDFDESTLVGEGEVFMRIPLKLIQEGTYEYIRVSLSYQNYDISLRYADQFGTFDIEGRVASFIAFNTFIRSFKPNQSTLVVQENKPQGFWAFESVFGVDSGSAPGTTVPNPIADTSPIPTNSCLVTGAFEPGKLVITGNENKDIEVTLSLSTNKSFEWKEVNADGKWEPAIGEQVVDMGIRGMIPYVEK